MNCTMTSNGCFGGAGGELSTPVAAGSPGKGVGGGVFNQTGDVTIVNTVIAGNAAVDDSPDLYGEYQSTGYNLIGNNQGATNLSVNDFQNVPVTLGPLQDNGGPTLTCVPQPGSLAIGYGTSIGGPTTDQRGVPRPRRASCDIGAVQVVTTAPYLLGPISQGTSGFSFTSIFDSTNAYRIQASTNLAAWVDVTNCHSGGLQHFLDSSAINRRFYRAIVP